jgi:TonB family protein
VGFILFAMFKNLRFRLASCALVLLVALTSPPAKAGDKHLDSLCDKPLEVVSPPQLSKEAKAKLEKIRAQGYLAIVVNEGGEVTGAKVVRASPPEAADLLLEFVRSAKFKPRTGCGPTQVKINYTFGDH